MRGRLAHTVERLCFQLAHALTGDADGLPDFFERVHATIFQTVPQAQNLRFARRQTVKCRFQLLVKQVGRHFLRRGRAGHVFHEIAKGRIAFFVNRRLKADRTARDFQQVFANRGW